MEKIIFLRKWLSFHGFAIAICILATVKLKNWSALQFQLGFLMIVFYLGWVILEPLFTGRRKGSGNHAEDKGTFQWYYWAKCATVLSALMFPTLFYDSMFHFYGGTALFLGGLFLRGYSIWTLGNYYSHFVEHQPSHQIIDKGPYRIIRHPSYTGMLFSHLGFVVFFLNIASVMTLFFLFIPAVLKRIHVEETMLMRQVEGYDAYSLHRKRLIPFLW